MTNKILPVVALSMVLFSFSISSTYVNATDVTAEEIQASQRQVQEAIEKAKNTASQKDYKQDASKYRIEVPVSPADQIADQAKKAINQLPSSNTVTTVGAIPKCETVTNNIDLQITKFNQGKISRIRKFQIVSEKLTDLVQKLKAEKVDTKILEFSLTELNNKIKKYNLVQENYSSSISKTKAIACTNPENEFKSSLQDTQNSLKTVKENAKDLQDYVQKTIRPEIQKIREQLKK